MKSSSVLLVALSLAACGGKKSGTTPSGGTAEGDDAATPFNDATLKATLRSTPGVEACGIDASTTMGAHFEAQRAILKGGDSSAITNESFTCRAQPDTTWECQWAVMSVASAPAAEPSLDEPAAEEPCGGDGGTGYIIIMVVANDGTLDTSSIICNAPG